VQEETEKVASALMSGQMENIAEVRKRFSLKELSKMKVKAQASQKREKERLEREEREDRNRLSLTGKMVRAVCLLLLLNTLNSNGTF
jgi:hypothetical protein